MRSWAISFFASVQTITSFLFFLGLAIALLAVALRLKSRRTKKVMIFAAVTAAWVPIWPIFPGYFLAKRECEMHGGVRGEDNLPFVGNNVLLVDDWARDRYYFDLTAAAHLLLESRIKRVEVQVKQGVSGQPFKGYVDDTMRHADGDGEYFVYELARLGDPNCQDFEKLPPSSIEFYRMIGLATNQCIAIERQPESSAEIVVRRSGGIDRSWISYEYDRYAVFKVASPERAYTTNRFSYHGVNPYYSKRFSVECDLRSSPDTFVRVLSPGALVGTEYEIARERFSKAPSKFRVLVSEATGSDVRDRRQIGVDAHFAYVSDVASDLVEYSKSSHFLVRWAVAQNMHADKHTLQNLAGDASDEVSSAARSTLQMVNGRSK